MHLNNHLQSLGAIQNLSVSEQLSGPARTPTWTVEISYEGRLIGTQNDESGASRPTYFCRAVVYNVILWYPDPI
ncbi:hypothetical protein PNOK_0931000 [Pyrrhoderma noxium]|uniref:Uncharacterized protein n=1 Tax=Pyrrhoderma noxium TaxID=2282107 RepID=A0A286U5B3_9AGAM|nr:hypothetical protein PNOK_0931000 [Pyrrhoderma noxium]